jgi:hypothetical protein
MEEAAQGPSQPTIGPSENSAGRIPGRTPWQFGGIKPLNDLAATCYRPGVGGGDQFISQE